MKEEQTTLYVIVGLPGAGKTTRARELEVQEHALRFTPDEWMIPLFGESDADGKRDILEGRFVWLALQALRLGTNVILDFGVWARDERSALKHLASKAGATCELVYLPIGHAEQRRRVVGRLSVSPATTFAMTDEQLAEYRELFQEPDVVELGTHQAGPSPAGYASWEHWIQERWPTALPPED